MNPVFHLTRKDLRHSRWLIAATWLVAATILWLPFTPAENRAETLQWLRFLRYVSWILLYLTIGRAVQLDAPLRDTAFLRSRPVSSGQWLASKTAAALLIVLPMAFVQIAALPLSGLRPGILDLTLAFAEELLALGIVASLSMVLSAKSKNPSEAIAALMSFLLAAIAIVVIHMNLSHRLMRGSGMRWSYDDGYLEYSRLLMAQFVALAGLSWALLRFIRKPLPSRLNTWMAVTAPAVAGAWLFWPLNFVKTFTAAEAEAPRSEWPVASKLELRFKTSRAAPAPFFLSSGGNIYGVEYRAVRALCSLDGMPDGWFAYPNDYRSAIRLPNGVTLQSRHTGWGNLTPELILPALGIPHARRDGGLSQVEIASFPAPSIKDPNSRVSIEGTIGVPLKRPVILARLPLRTGAGARIGSRLITITKSQMIGETIEYAFTEERSVVRARGAWWGEPCRSVGTIVVHPARGEFLKQQSRSSGSVRSGCYAITKHHQEETIWRDPFKQHDEPVVPDDWLDGAELLITGDESGGTFTREFRFENVNLTDPSWRP